MRIVIDGMSCGHCVGHVKEALESIEGIGSVEVNLSEKTAYVQGNVTEEKVKEVIEDAGYDVISIQK